jgi:hypothetical protein
MAQHIQSFAVVHAQCKTTVSVKHLNVKRHYVLWYPFMAKLIRSFIDATQDALIKPAPDMENQEYCEILLKKTAPLISSLLEASKEVRQTLGAICPNGELDNPDVHERATYVDRLANHVVDNFEKAVTTHGDGILNTVATKACAVKDEVDKLLADEKVDLDKLAEVAMESEDAKALFRAWMQWKEFAELPKKLVKKAGMPDQTFSSIEESSKTTLEQHGPTVSGLLLISAALRPLKEGESRSKLIRAAKAAAAKEPYAVDDKIQLLTTQLMNS